MVAGETYWLPCGSTGSQKCRKEVCDHDGGGAEALSHIATANRPTILQNLCNMGISSGGAVALVSDPQIYHTHSRTY